ncbi:MAG: DUF4397 domain-containing protein [Chitinophagaceae bacterium]
MKRNILSIRPFLVATSVLLATAILFSACKKNLDGGQNSPVAGLMAFNLAPDKSTVGISLSGNQLVSTPLAYTNYTGGYLNIYPGDRSIKSFNYMQDSSLATSSFNFEPNKYYSLFLVGNNGTYQNVVAWDDLDSLSSTSGKAYVRYINAIPDSSAPTVTITANGSNVVSNPVKFATVSAFTPVTPGEINVSVVNTNETAANRTITLEGGKAYTLLLVGVAGATDSTKSVQIKFIKNAG